MQKMRLKCPQCEEHITLYLSSKPYVLVLNCPGCTHNLLHYSGETVEINDLEVFGLEKGDWRALMEKVHAPNRRLHVSNTLEPVVNQQSLQPPTGRPNRAVPIGNEDILNLKIDLESCQDVNDFLNRW